MHRCMRVYMRVCPPPAATSMNACWGSVLSGKAFIGHVLVMLITDMLRLLAPGEAQGQQ